MTTPPLTSQTGSRKARGPLVDIARLNRLRAAVLGANDGIVSVAAVVVGVSGATAQTSTLALSGGAALVAGALSMAAGEYVSVAAQRDAERAAVAQADGAGANRGPHVDTAALSQGFVNPWQAAVASFLSFVVGGMLPFVAMLTTTSSIRLAVTVAAVCAALIAVGAISAKLGDAAVGPAIRRNLIGGTLAMAVTYGIGLITATISDQPLAL